MGLLLSALVAGCGGAVSVKQPINQAPLIQPAPVSVAIYYAEDLRSHMCTGRVNGFIAFPYSWTFALGPPSIEMFDILFTRLFTDVETLVTDPKITPPSDRRDIIELRLSDFKGCESYWVGIGESGIDIAYEIEITYEAIVWSVDGEKVAQWKGQGRGGPRDDVGKHRQSGLESTSYYAALTSVAMRKAAADFIFNFESDPAVRAWLGE